ncbi:recombinase family protein [Corynebacterium diphtheriae]|uniref:hypothetical protein n=1 Tax=Corynebacterium belfantii TaxID=2014537 RepID=UPI0013C66233|nr:hypothetical protein [Corynebacterium belfantii]MBG9318311.1 hypothetical protein [Corynebacterium belfantii]CAB0645525.1 recombinase family protein [Corynebacterium diphtheriae]
MRGQVPQYYVEGNHEPIIDPEVWELAQHIMCTTPSAGRADRTFSHMVFCEHCGGLYGAKTWHSTSKYKRVVRKYNDRYEVEHLGKTPTVTDEQLQRAWTRALAGLVKRHSLIDWKELHAMLAGTTEVEAELVVLQGELEVVTELMTRAIEDNKTSVQDQDEYWARYTLLEERYTQTTTKLGKIQELLARRQACGIELGRMRKAITALTPDALVNCSPLVGLRNQLPTSGEQLYACT